MTLEGDATSVHNTIRDTFADYAARAGLHPREVPEGLIRDDTGTPTAERPADVLIVPRIHLRKKLPDGSRGICADKMCLDFAVVNALGPDHWMATSQQAGLACEHYADRKRTRAASCSAWSCSSSKAVAPRSRMPSCEELRRALQIVKAAQQLACSRPSRKGWLSSLLEGQRALFDDASQS